MRAREAAENIANGTSARVLRGGILRRLAGEDGWIADDDAASDALDLVRGLDCLIE